MWRMPWNKRKQQQALNCNLLKELEVDDASYRRYIRMDPSHFKALSHYWLRQLLLGAIQAFKIPSALTKDWP
jgi:hypothetical protein